MSAEAESIVIQAAADAAPAKTAAEPAAADTTPDAAPVLSATDAAARAEQERAEKILKGKELFSQGSRNFLVKSYDEAADELSQVCQLYEEVYGELADELGQPLLLYAKSLIAMALDENKVIDVPDEANDDDEEDVDDDDDADAEEQQPAKQEANGAASSTNGSKLSSIKERADEADSTGDAAKKPADEPVTGSAKPTGSDEVSSSGADADAAATSNGSAAANKDDDERPSTSNGEAAASTSNGGNATSVGVDDDPMDDEEGEGVSGSLQLAWEILEAAAKIFSRQGLSGLPYLADVQTELANIEFENGILDAAREDYEKALKIHGELSTKNRRALAELHYKIGLTYLMQQMNTEGAAALRNSSQLIEEEIAAIQAKDTADSEREKNNILDLEETKQEILAKIQEIEEMQAQTIAEVRAALDSYIKPMSSGSGGDAAAASSSTSSSAANGTAAAASSSSSSTSAAGSAASSSAISSSSKPTDISHLIKRKKPEEPNSEAEALCSPAKRAAV